jgi:protocatechuate 3,4-dioxygenase beta subunit
MDVSTLFSDAGACMLMPVVDEGPLYVKGEQIRKDITENEPGIKMTLAIQVVDYKTCKVVPDAYVDIWSSNSTGIYTGVQGYPGMGDPKDASILKLTALRGVQPTDSHGIATFDGLLPGHYEGRATHIHAIVYLGGTKAANNTVINGKAAHVGQLYFDQSLLTAADKVTPYNKNRGAITQNVNDFLFRQGANGDDPMVRYAFVGDKLEDGLFSWIRFGINQNTARKVNPAAYMTSGGGVMNPTGPVAAMNRGGGGFGAIPGFPRPQADGETEKREAEEEQ